jgi:hypothetical protein
MNKSNLNISNIENYLFTLFDNVVSNNTFIGTLPDTIDASWTDMVLIDFGTSINDLDAMGRCIVHIFLYAKPLANGSKNVRKLAEMEDKFNEVMLSQKDKTYQLSHVYDDSDYDKDRKWHFNIKALNLMIF